MWAAHRSPQPEEYGYSLSNTPELVDLDWHHSFALTRGTNQQNSTFSTEARLAFHSWRSRRVICGAVIVCLVVFATSLRISSGVAGRLVALARTITRPLD